MARPLIAVIGGSVVDAHTASVAHALGTALAKRGFSILCGGRGGIMDATARGLREAREASPPEDRARDALAIGILPEDHADNANPWLDIAIPTGVGLARNALIARGASAAIAIAGESGTLSEMALVWQFDVPLCALDCCGGWAARLAGQPLDSRRSDVVHPAHTAEEAAEWALTVLRTPLLGKET